MVKHYFSATHQIRIDVCTTVCLCVAGALSEGHRGRNVKAALGASVVLMD